MSFFVHAQGIKNVHAGILVRFLRDLKSPKFIFEINQPLEPQAYSELQSK